jgi:hypothetical protein
MVGIWRMISRVSCVGIKELRMLIGQKVKSSGEDVGLLFSSVVRL